MAFAITDEGVFECVLNDDDSITLIAPVELDSNRDHGDESRAAE